MNVARGISDILTSLQLVGGASSWKVYLEELGIQPQSVAVINRAGKGKEINVNIDYPAVQILVRGNVNDFEGPLNKAGEIDRALHNIPQNPVSFPELVSCINFGNILPLGKDEEERPVYSINFNLITEPADPGHRI